MLDTHPSLTCSVSCTASLSVCEKSRLVRWSSLSSCSGVQFGNVQFAYTVQVVTVMGSDRQDHGVQVTLFHSKGELRLLICAVMLLLIHSLKAERRSSTLGNSLLPWKGERTELVRGGCHTDRLETRPSSSSATSSPRCKLFKRRSSGWSFP